MIRRKHLKQKKKKEGQMFDSMPSHIFPRKEEARDIKATTFWKADIRGKKEQIPLEIQMTETQH